MAGIRNFILFIFTSYFKYYQSDEIKKVGMSRTRSMINACRELKERVYLGDTGIDGLIKLIRILQK